MEKILQIMKERREATGLTVHYNPFTYGSYVRNENGKVVFEGDAISCEVYVNGQYAKTLNSKQGVQECDATGLNHGTEPMEQKISSSPQGTK